MGAMLLRIVNYQPIQGGIPRFVTELLAAMVESSSDWKFEFISHGPGLKIYQQSFHEREIEVRCRDIRPRDYWRNHRPSRVFGLPGTGRLLRSAGFGRKFEYEVPPQVFDGCDAVWFPSLHGHRLPLTCGGTVVGSYHDTLGFEFDMYRESEWREVERDLTRRNLSSSITLVVSSNATVNSMKRLFGACSSRIHVVPLASDNPGLSREGQVPAQWTWSARPFLLCPASLMPNKNHEGLFDGYALWRRWPLVLTGVGMEFSRRAGGRAGYLRDYAVSRGLSIGIGEECDIQGLGYVSDDLYLGLLRRAAAVIMPTLAEGGGSFPVAEAISNGVPVLCSDIPVMREHLERLGAETIWFNPRDSADLEHALKELEENYENYKARAVDQMGRLSRRSWHDVAEEYWRLIDGSNMQPNREVQERCSMVECRAMDVAQRASLAQLFTTLATNGDETDFYPHPLNPEQVEWLVAYAGQDYYCVLVESGGVLGYGMLRGWDEGYDVPSLGIALHPTARGRGFSRLLMNHLHQIARQRSATRIRLKANETNEVALALYRKLGYQLQDPEGGQISGFVEL